MAKSSKLLPLTHPEIGEFTRRQMAMEAFEATALLAKAIEKQDMAGIELALSRGALPDLCHFGRGKTSNGSALSRALPMKDLDLLTRLMDAGATAKMPKRAEPLLIQTQRIGYPGAFVLFLKRLKPKTTLENTLMALCSSNADFLRALDEVSFLPRNEPLSGFPEHDFRRNFPPLFQTVSRNVHDYLIETGTDPFRIFQNHYGVDVDLVDFHLENHPNHGDDLVPLIEPNLRAGKTISAAQMTKVAERALTYANVPNRLLSLLAEHCPGWTWQGFLQLNPHHQPNKSKLFHLQALEDDRRLRVTLEDTLPSGRTLTPRRSL
jgi:hypothetical protein